MTQNNLGNALRILGERESGTARLEEAVSVYEAALDELGEDNAYLRANVAKNLERAGEVLKRRRSPP